MRSDNMQIVMIPVMKIIPYWRNPRRNDATVEMLIEIIKEYGFNVPIVLDVNNVVVKGHARLRAAKRLGMEEVPCIYSDADPETIKADRIADNKIQEMSYFDLAKLEMEFQRIGELKFDKLFHPEEFKPMDVDYTVSEFKPVGLGDFDGDMQEDGTTGSAGYAPYEGSDVPYEAPAYMHDGEQWEGGESDYGAPTGLNERKRCRTVCPYCGKDVIIWL